MNNTSDQSLEFIKYNNLVTKVVAFTVILIAIVLAIIYGIRAYSNTKQMMLQSMRVDGNAVATTFYNEVNYSQYFINLIKYQLQSHYKNHEYVRRVLQNSIKSSDIHYMFGWKRFSWINKDFFEIIDSKNGIRSFPKKRSYVESIVSNNLWQEHNIFFAHKDKKARNNSLKMIVNLQDNLNNYVGSLVLSYDIAALSRCLNHSRKYKYSNFLILNDKFEIVVQSKENIPNIIDDKKNLSNLLTNSIYKISNSSNSAKIISYLDMLNGTNFYIKKIDNLPFILVVSLDSDQIKKDLFDKMIKKLIEIFVIATIATMLIISIYRRETWLRIKAQAASIAATRATKAKSDFLAFTAHEIRSSLSFILTGSEVMVKQILGKLPENYYKYAEGIHQSAKKILNFMTDILDENQVLTGKFSIVNSIVNIEDLINEAIYTHKTKFNQRNIDIQVEYDTNLPKVRGDSFRILQVINNLLSNAIKYSKNHVQIVIRLFLMQDNRLRLEIEDKGIGMSEDDIQAVINGDGIIHKKSDHIQKYNFIESYGLGIQIVKLIAKAHDIELIINSEKEVGTSISLIFPNDRLIWNYELDGEV